MNEREVTEVFQDHREVKKINEYATDWDDEKLQFEEHSEVVKRACVTRCGRAARAFVLLEM